MNLLESWDRCPRSCLTPAPDSGTAPRFFRLGGSVEKQRELSLPLIEMRRYYQEIVWALWSVQEQNWKEKHNCFSVLLWLSSAQLWEALNSLFCGLLLFQITKTEREQNDSLQWCSLPKKCRSVFQIKKYFSVMEWYSVVSYEHCLHAIISLYSVDSKCSFLLVAAAAAASVLRA